MYFLRKIIFHFLSKEKISYFPKKKIPSFQIYKKDHIPARFFWKDHVFGAFEENIKFHVFVEKDHLSFSV